MARDGSLGKDSMNHLHRIAGAACALATLAVAAPAVAQPYGYAGDPPVVYGAPPPVQGRALTVNRRQGYDPYNKGLATVVTAPVHVASELVALPFRVVNSVFPPDPRTPLAVVGAPVYAAGQVAQVPFHVIQAPFGDRYLYGE
jgi:hypothetical protein